MYSFQDKDSNFWPYEAIYTTSKEQNTANNLSRQHLETMIAYTTIVGQTAHHKVVLKLLLIINAMLSQKCLEKKQFSLSIHLLWKV